MKIFVVSRNEISSLFHRDANFLKNNWIISISSSNDKQSPFPNRGSVLKLIFDDITEKDDVPELIHFDKVMAEKIVSFVKSIEDDGKKEFFVHCDAGVSRSGAVGFLLNEWFNKFIEMKRIDNEAFVMNNRHILPNPEVMRILKREMFGDDFKGIFVNDYTFNEDGEMIDHIEEI